jgi:hypothetical protein
MMPSFPSLTRALCKTSTDYLISPNRSAKNHLSGPVSIVSMSTSPRTPRSKAKRAPVARRGTNFLTLDQIQATGGPVTLRAIAEQILFLHYDKLLEAFQALPAGEHLATAALAVCLSADFEEGAGEQTFVLHPDHEATHQRVLHHFLLFFGMTWQSMVGKNALLTRPLPVHSGGVAKVLEKGDRVKITHLTLQENGAVTLIIREGKNLNEHRIENLVIPQIFYLLTY